MIERHKAENHLPDRELNLNKFDNFDVILSENKLFKFLNPTFEDSNDNHDLIKLSEDKIDINNDKIFYDFLINYDEISHENFDECVVGKLNINDYENKKLILENLKIKAQIIEIKELSQISEKNLLKIKKEFLQARTVERQVFVYKNGN